MPGKVKKFPKPTPIEAARAVYIDFEGTAIDPPSLLGVLVGDKFVQYVIEEDLWPAAIANSGTSAATCELAELNEVCELLASMTEEGRRIFAWSSREVTAISEGAPEFAGFAAERVEDAKRFAKSWKAQFHPDVVLPKTIGKGRHQLGAYLAMIDYSVPKAFGPGNSAQRLKTVRLALQKYGGDWNRLTPVMKAKWTKALKHNWYDCDGMRAVVERIAQGRR